MESRVNPTITSTLIGVHAALALAAGLLPILLPVSDSAGDIPAAVLALSQMSLLSLWIGFGNSHVFNGRKGKVMRQSVS